jgi:hypothetical protein
MTLRIGAEKLFYTLPRESPDLLPRTMHQFDVSSKVSKERNHEAFR